MPRKSVKVIERLRRKTKYDQVTGCWVFTGATKEFGHGVIGAGRRGEGVVRVHRVSWEHHNGPIPDGLSVLHQCDNPPCWNPDHLFLGTQLDNMRDMSRKGRFSRPAAKLTLRQVVRLREMKASGSWTNAELSKKFGVGKRQVQKIANGDQWKSIQISS